MRHDTATNCFSRAICAHVSLDQLMMAVLVGGRVVAVQVRLRYVAGDKGRSMSGQADEDDAQRQQG